MLDAGDVINHIRSYPHMWRPPIPSAPEDAPCRISKALIRPVHLTSKLLYQILWYLVLVICTEFVLLCNWPLTT